MIPVPALGPESEPELFDANCRVPGNQFLEVYPDKDPHEKSDWWSAFKPALAQHFGGRCGWLGTSVDLMGAQVDHYLACGNRNGGPSPNRHLAFD